MMIEKTTSNRNYPKPDIDNTLQDDVVNIASAIDKIDTDIHGINQTMPLLAGSYPFLYCKMRRCGRSSGSGGISTSNEMGTLNNNIAAAPLMFKNFFGGNDSTLDVYSIPPLLQFVGPSAGWIKSDSWLEYVTSDIQHEYRSYEMILMFIKNITTVDITSNFSRYYSGASDNTHWNYSSVYLGTPDQTDANRSTISTITWTVAETISSANSGATSSFDVTIPAGKTIALLFYSSPTWNTSTMTDLHIFNGTIGIYNFGAFLTTGLEVDHKRTLKALQMRTQNIHEIWR
jgi:hypothetical protein